MAANNLSWPDRILNSLYGSGTYRNTWLSITLVFLLLPFHLSVAHAQDGAARQKIWSELGHSHWVAQGNGTRALYVIFDPNCPYCHVLIDELQSQIKPMHLQVRYLIVGFLAPSSSGKAAYILQAKDPLAALLENEKKFNMQHFGGVPETLPDAKSDKILQQNMALLQSSGRRIVPTMIYRQRNGKIKIIKGALNATNLHDALKEIPLHPKTLPGQ